MKKPSELSFAEFAEGVNPSGAVNRLPSIGNGADVHSYSVYMNGPLANSLPLDARDHEFRDVMLYALTDRLGLNSGSFRDNLKVAELVATRSAWMSAVLESSLDRSTRMPDSVTEDYELLTNGMSHPWIQGELAKQRALSAGLQPALDMAGKAMGGVVVDRAPGEITVGRVVSQNPDFTVQATVNGEVVTHENRRLGAVPVLGEEVTVAYYRGEGQVIDEKCVGMSDPFVDKTTGDLAVKLFDAQGRDKQMLLFNGVASFAKFIEAQRLDKSIVAKAIEVREANPKALLTKALPVRERVSIYKDEGSGCLAVDYMESGGKFTALFSDAAAMEAYAQEYGLGAADIEAGKALESGGIVGGVNGPKDAVLESLKSALSKVCELGLDEENGPLVEGRNYVGRVVAASSLHLVQKVDRGTVVIHDVRDLDKLPAEGDMLSVSYAKGRGRVSEMVKEGGQGRG